MKQLAVLVMALLSMSAFSQKSNGPKKEKRAEMSVEQLATLRTKKMTLALDLTESQQDKIMKINVEEVEYKKARRAEVKAKKESGQKPSTDERFEIANAKLDHKIAHQQKIKEVLTKEQYLMWKELKTKRAMKGKKTMRKEGRKG